MKPKTLANKVIEDIRQQYLKNPALNNVDWFLNAENGKFLIETSYATFDPMDEGGFRTSSTMTLDPTTGKVERSMAAVEEDLSILVQKYSPSGKYKVMLKANRGGMLIEIFSRDGLLSRQVVPPTTHMGLIRKSNAYLTESVSWSEDENRFMYMADDTKPMLNFFKLKHSGVNRYRYEDLPGERLQTHTNPSVFIYDIEAKSLIRLQKPNRTATSRIVYAHPQFADPKGHSLVCVAMDMVNSFEMAFFTNYPKKLKYLNQLTMSRVHRDFLKNKFIVPKEVTLSVDPQEQPVVYFPKVSPDFKRVVYLFADVLMKASANVFGLRVLSLERPEEKPSTVIEVVKKEPEGGDFSGIQGMNYGLNAFGWLDNQKVVFTSYFKLTNQIYEVDVDSKTLRRISKKLYLEGEAQSLVGVLDSRHLLLKCDTAVKNGSLFVMRKTGDDYDQVMMHRPVDEAASMFEETIVVNNIEALFYGKKDDKVSLEERGMIIWTHGGPHNIFPNIMNPVIYYLMQMGFTVVNVNYTGSSGRGQDFMTKLHGLDKYTEADDVHNTLQHLIAQKKCNPKNIGYISGSTGGLIGLLHITKYPDEIKAMSIFNPPLEANCLNNESCFPGLGPSRYLGDNSPWSPLEDLTDEQIIKSQATTALCDEFKFSTQVLLFGGLKDSIICRGSNRHLYKQCREKGLKFDYFEYPDDEHFILLPKNTYDYAVKSILVLLGAWKFN